MVFPTFLWQSMTVTHYKDTSTRQTSALLTSKGFQLSAFQAWNTTTLRPILETHPGQGNKVRSHFLAKRLQSFLSLCSTGEQCHRSESICPSAQPSREDQEQSASPAQQTRQQQQMHLATGFPFLSCHSIFLRSSQKDLQGVASAQIPFLLHFPLASHYTYKRGWKL